MSEQDITDDLTTAYMYGAFETRTEMTRRIVAMNAAMNDLLKSPKGVVPESAERFYDGNEGVFK